MNEDQLFVSVNNRRCEIYGVCQQEAPAVFQLTDDHTLSYRSHPEPELRERVMAAARRCPKQAIEVSGSVIGAPVEVPLTDERIVIVGAGIAGLSAATKLRERGFSGEVVLIGDERYPTYDRTAISKDFLVGQRAVSDLRVAVEGLDIQWLVGTRVRSIDITENVVRLPGAVEMRYDGLVISSGSEAVRPPGFPHHKRVLTLRTLEDAQAIHATLASASRVAVVGDGVLGTELAAMLRERLLDVTLIGAHLSPLNRALGSRLGTVEILPLHSQAGVHLQLGVNARSCVAHGDSVTLELNDGQCLSFDVVLVATGCVPSTDWLADSGIDVSDGVLCAPSCHAVTYAGQVLDDVVAAGDVARWPNLRFDSVPRRVEHWIHAIDMGEAAADALLDGPEEAKPFTPVPRFWTEQFGVRIQVEGIPNLGTDLTTLEGTAGLPGHVGGFTRKSGDGHSDQLVGVVAVDNPMALQSYHDGIGSLLSEFAL